MPFPIDGSTSSLLDSNRPKNAEFSNYFNNRRIMTAHEELKCIIIVHQVCNYAYIDESRNVPDLKSNISVQNNIYITGVSFIK